MGEYDEQTQPGAHKRPEPQRLSVIFSKLAADVDGPVSLRSVRTALGDRSFAALLVFFALLNLIPLPPPSSAILGLPLIIVAGQMVYGSQTVWLPRAILDRSLTPDQFRSAMARLMPWLIRLERYIRPRYWPFWPKQGERIIGVIALLLSIIVTLPIPLGNWTPAFAVTLLGLSLFEKDGVLLGFGMLVGVIAVAIVALVVGSATAAIGFVWTHAGAWFQHH